MSIIPAAPRATPAPLAGHPAIGLADHIADLLTRPGDHHGTVVPVQSLAYGLPGIALLHIERAAAGHAPWEHAHAWLTRAASAPVTAGPDSHPYHGVPALAHALACAAEALPGSYRRALATLEEQIAAEVRRRLQAAHARIDAGLPPRLAEFDTIRGLTGYGAYLLRRHPDGRDIRDVLAYLVRLTAPVRIEEEHLPGWWSGDGPSGRPDPRFPGGHANSGLAHGIAGPLALLALAKRAQVTVEGHDQAIAAICAWLDRWRVDTGHRPVWPYWVTRSALRSGRPVASEPQRPSWCYGVMGVARAQHLAALATGDPARQQMAEHAMAAALAHPQLHATTTDRGLCHGLAGLAFLAARAAADATPETAARLTALIGGLLDELLAPHADPRHVAAGLLAPDGRGPGLLEGAAGVALAASAAVHAPRSGWDACLLVA